MGKIKNEHSNNRGNIVADADRPTSQNSPSTQKSGCWAKFCFVILGLIFILVLIGIFGGIKNNNLKTATTPTPAINKTPTPNSPATTTKTSTPTPTKKSTETPSEAPKQWYYLVGCSDCQNPGCLSRYYYDGTNAGEYYTNKAYCESCDCNNVKARSYQR